MKKETRVFLYGIQGLYNYGCEAMVRSITKSLLSAYSSIKIYYITPSIVNDRKILKDLDTISIIELKKNNYSLLKKGFRYTKRKLGIAKPIDYLHYDVSWITECDVLIVIGGDIFDLTPESKNKKKYINSKVFVSQMVKNKGGKVFLWGISIGDFDCNPYAKKH